MARYWVETTTGAKRNTIYGKTREEVAEKLADALSDRNKGLVFDDENITVGECLERWLEDSVRGSVRASTYESYKRQLGRYVVPDLGRMKLKRLDAMHVQGLYRSMLDRAYPPAPSATPTRSSAGG